MSDRIFVEEDSSSRRIWILNLRKHLGEGGEKLAPASRNLTGGFRCRNKITAGGALRSLRRRGSANLCPRPTAHGRRNAFSGDHYCRDRGGGRGEGAPRIRAHPSARSRRRRGYLLSLSARSIPRARGRNYRTTPARNSQSRRGGTPVFLS